MATLMHDATRFETTHTDATAMLIDAGSRRVLEDLQLVAKSQASILLIGETGTGKEVFARHLHERSRRAGPFVAVNCGALSANLGEAALFGHEAGAYTGAAGARAGWFESAHGGTLFLDEVGDLPLSLQVALLRVLQENQVVRLGSRKAIPLDVRVVAATNIDVGKALSAGQFRLDLYFRLSVVTLELPPLRQRLADILPLAEHFIALYSQRLQREPARLDAAARTALLQYTWPGNIRELENVMHAAVLTCGEEGVIRQANLRLAALTAAARQADPLEALQVQLDRLLAAGHERLFERVESLTIQRAWEACAGNQVRTARLLGISRNVLRTYLKRFGLIGGDAIAESPAEPPEEPDLRQRLAMCSAVPLTQPT